MVQIQQPPTLVVTWELSDRLRSARLDRLDSAQVQCGNVQSTLWLCQNSY